VQNFAGLQVDRPLAPVLDGDVDAFLERLRESLAQLQPITDRTRAERGDVVTIDYEARRDDRVVGRGDNRLLELGRGAFTESFDTQLEGAEVGSTREFTVAYPTEHSNAELAGQQVHFRVTVKALASKEMPPLDDDFAKDHGECETLTELRERVRQRLEAEAVQRADEAVRAGLIDKLVRDNEIMVPEAMVHRRAHALAEDFLHSMRNPRLPQRDERGVLERLSTELEPRAREQVKAALLLEAVARQEHIEIGETEVQTEIEQMVAQAGNAGERVRALYQEESARAALRARMLQQRALDVVASRATITTVEPTSSVADAEQKG